MITNASKYNNKRAKFDRAGGNLGVTVDTYVSSTRERIEIQMNEYGVETTRSREASLNVVSGLDKDAVFGLGCQLYSRHCLQLRNLRYSILIGIRRARIICTALLWMVHVV